MDDSHDDKVTNHPRARAARKRSGSETRQRRRAISFHLTPEERAATEAAAARAGMSFEEYIRSVVLPVDDLSVRRTLNGLATELNRVGLYIDEIVGHMETGNLPDLPQAREAQRNNREAVRELRRALKGGSH